MKKRPCTIKKPSNHTGFTLIELVVTMALAALLIALAAPSVRSVIVRNQLVSTGSEFTAAVMRARNEAVNRNVCVTLCMSSRAADATPACTSAGSDWQVGWIAFINKACNSGTNTPASTDLLLGRMSQSTDIRIIPKSSSPTKKMLFNPTGSPGLGAADQFNLIFRDVGDPLTERYAFNICLDGLGRTQTIPSNQTCAAFR